MRAVGSILSVALQVAITASMAHSDEIHWVPDLEDARELAKSQNRLLLVHFWTPDCTPCAKLEQNVLNLPSVAQTMNDFFVPVKVNAHEHPDIALQMNVDRWPTDVILTATGELISKATSPQDPREYLAQLSVAAYRTGNVQLAARTDNYRAVDIRKQHSRFDSDVGAGFASGGMQTDRPPTEATRPDSTTQPSHWPDRSNEVINHFAGKQRTQATPSQPAVTPTFNPPAGGVSVPAAQKSIDLTNRSATSNHHSISHEPGRDVQPPSNVAAPSESAPGRDSLNRWDNSFANSTVTNPVPSTQLGPPSGEPKPSEAWQESIPQTRDTDSVASWNESATTQADTLSAQDNTFAGSFDPPQEPNQADVEAGPDDADADFPADNPIGMDGYCPVTLATEKAWRKGDSRWGAIHRGRTYLFASANQQRVFLANPDAYSPVLSGLDAVVLIEDRKSVGGKREHGLVYKKHIYLFASEENLGRFWESPERYAGLVRQALQTGSLQPLVR